MKTDAQRRLLQQVVRALAKRWKSRITMIQVRGIYTDRIGEKLALEIKKCLADLRKHARKRPNR